MPGRAPLPPVWWVCRSGAQGVACFLCRLLTLPLACLIAPYPPARARRALFPSGEGGDFLFSYARGFAPCIPGAEPMVRRKAERNRFPASGAAGVQPPGTCLAGTISAVGGSVQGCRGLRPRRNKLWDSPFPAGRGMGGWGKEIKPKVGLVGDKEGKPPFGHRQHPPIRRPAGQATHRAPATQVQPVPLSARARGCKGRSPLHENNLNLPPSRREGGRGDGGSKASQRQGWQATKKALPPLGTANARRSGDLPDKPPAGHHSGRDSQCRRGTPPHRAPQRQG